MMASLLCRDEAEGVFGLEKRTRRIPIAKYLRARAAADGKNQEDPVRVVPPKPALNFRQ